MKSVKIILLAIGVALLVTACNSSSCACPGKKKYYKQYSEALTSANVALRA